MKEQTINDWSLEPTFNKLMLVGAPDLAEAITTTLDIPMDVLIDVLRDYDCGDVQYGSYLPFAYRPEAQMTLSAIIGMLDTPPQNVANGYIDENGLDVLANGIRSLLRMKADVLRTESLASRQTHTSCPIRERFAELDLTVSSIAKALRISRTTLYAYMKSYDEHNLSSIPVYMKYLFHRIENDTSMTQVRLWSMISKVSWMREHPASPITRDVIERGESL